MLRRMRLGLRVLLALAATPPLACAEEEEAASLRARLQGEDFRNSFRRAPGMARPLQRVSGPHGFFADIYVNRPISDAISAGAPLRSWPEGSIIVEEAWATRESAAPDFLLVMERRRDEWFWASWQGDGSLLYAGEGLDVCVQCHDAGADQVRSFGLPPL